MKRAKRLFPKHMSATYINTGRIDHNKASAYNAQRSKATEGPRSNSLHKPTNSFMEEIPKTRNLSTHDPDVLDGKTGERLGPRNWKRVKKHAPMWPSERKKVMEHPLMVVEGPDKKMISLYRVWQARKAQGVSEYYCTVIEKIGTEFKLMLFFSGTEFLFVQEYKETRRISRTYQGRDTAMHKYNNNSISWIGEEKIKT